MARKEPHRMSSSFNFVPLLRPWQCDPFFAESRWHEPLLLRCEAEAFYRICAQLEAQPVHA
jgi:hypothetical protein